LFEAELQPKIGFNSMSSTELTPEERSELLKLHKAEDGRKFADRIKTILLLDDGYSYSQISKVLFLDDQTIRHLTNHRYILQMVFTQRIMFSLNMAGYLKAPTKKLERIQADKD